MEKSIREMITEYQNELVKGNLVYQRAAEILTEISALIGNLNDEIVKRDVGYNKILLWCYGEEKSANRAKIRADITPEYEAMKTARNTKDLAIEMMRSLKYLLRSLEIEKKEATYQ